MTIQTITEAAITIQRVEPNGRQLVVHWADGHLSDFHYVWLRYNCWCDDCGDTRPGLRQLQLPQIPLDISPNGVHLDETGRLRLTWANDGHETILEPAWLREHCYSPRARAERRPQPILWDASIRDNLPTVEYAEAQANEAIHLQMLRHLRDYGFVLVRGVTPVPEETEKIVGMFGLIRETSYGRVFDLIAKPNATVSGNKANYLTPHTDEPFRYGPPGVIFFHCIESAAASGGASILVDGFKVADVLRQQVPDAFDLLTRIPQQFHRIHQDEVDFRSDGRTISVDVDGHIVGFRFNDRCTAPIDLPPDLIEPFFDASQKLASLVYDEQYHLTYQLRPGDLLAFDNHRVMHGRTAFDPSLGRRHMRSCHVDRDGVFSQLRVLSRRLNRADVEQIIPVGSIL